MGIVARIAGLLGFTAALLIGADEAYLREALKAGAVVHLPPGTIEVTSPLELPSGVTVEGSAEGTIIRASDRFSGAAIFVARSVEGVRVRNLEIDGNRAALERPVDMPPHDIAFADHFTNNGLLVDRAEAVQISEVTFRNIAGFAILAARSSGVRISAVTVVDSGSKNARGRNNTSGGILFEEGVDRFSVIFSVFRRIGGNAIWTHSRYNSPRNSEAAIRWNRFEDIGRDAIQIGHATGIRVERNAGRRIGFPAALVDVEGGGIPVAIDTAGNVDKTVYASNRFEEINGKCIDLDGFHHGEVRENRCTNRVAPEEHPFGHFGIVMNNSNPDMQSEGIIITDNQIDGTKFGGIFVIGSGHRIERNRLLNLNAAGCNESRARFGCQHFEGEPDLLQSGIYLGRGAERPALAQGNIIRDNVITGYRMKDRCIAAAPGVDLKANQIERNQCRDQSRK